MVLEADWTSDDVKITSMHLYGPSNSVFLATKRRCMLDAIFISDI